MNHYALPRDWKVPAPRLPPYEPIQWPPKIVTVNRRSIDNEMLDRMLDCVFRVFSKSPTSRSFWLNEPAGWHELAEQIKYALDVSENSAGRRNQSRGHWNVVIGPQFAASVSHNHLLQLRIGKLHIFLFHK